MKYMFILLLGLTAPVLGQSNLALHLKENRQDLLKDNQLHLDSAHVIGFGALHGSAKTETAELLLLEELIKNHQLQYYFPETDFSTANFFQQYIETGDEELLKDLILAYGTRVPQEQTVAVFEKWKKLRPLFQQYQIKIIGIDQIASYKYSVLELLTITDSTATSKWLNLKRLHQLAKETSNWSAFYSTALQEFLIKFTADYQNNSSNYQAAILDSTKFAHIIQNISYTFKTNNREQLMYKNYLKLQQQYQCENDLQFFRLGVFHIMKSKINNSSTFFHKLITNQIYTAHQVVTIQGFLTKSRVLWETKLDNMGKYKGYSTRGGYGTADYWLEHYQNIRLLKQNKLSDLTLFSINTPNSPFAAKGLLDLVALKQLFSTSSWSPNPQKSTLDYIDYALLIRNSPAGVPIEEILVK